MTQKSLYKILLFAGMISATFAAPHVFAANPSVIITWQAQSYVPPNFQGKVLPTASSSVMASVEVLDNGKLADLSKQIIYWYADDTFLGGGPGAQTVTFSAPATSPNLVGLRVQIPGYPGGMLIKSQDIPVVDPEVVIDAPYPNHIFSDSQAIAIALPYFFRTANISDLTINWLVNGVAPENQTDPQFLVLSVNSQEATTIPVSVTVTDPANFLDSASADTSFVYQP